MKTTIGIAAILIAVCCCVSFVSGVTYDSIKEDAGIVDTVCTFLTSVLFRITAGDDVAYADTVDTETQLLDISTVDALKVAFNADKGDPRLLVLLSPT